jgi:hypothetical protein
MSFLDASETPATLLPKRVKLSLPFIPAKANHGHNGTGKAMMVLAKP